MGVPDGLPVLRTLAELADLAARYERLYVRWSRGPEVDLARSSSTDDLTGLALPGLSANPLDMEEWWQGRPARLWVARRLYDYSYLPHDKGPGGPPPSAD